ncbi:hypothetical protein N1027_08160 [Herbiconiux sp. CPCC 205763]|uniref:ABM domain-containing protein n=1 Tax=Herbiconiux aconitum TaxID=2970913 RepID=A0ABT2GPG1_9MICO|nr:hypothetical protein [Herbiconiux aconitum]MCS5718109.1 hypothetical protein [Herbiconiux aconitum]
MGNEVMRVWTATILTSDREAYIALVERTGLKEHSGIAGHIRSWVLARDLDAGYTEIKTMSLWESREAIEAFAGYDIDRSVSYPEEARYLIENSPWAAHYDVAMDSCQGIPA